VVVVTPLAYVLLRRWQLLNIYATLLIGGMVAALPYVGYAVTYAVDPLFLSSGRPDLAVLVPLWFFGGGAIGAGVAWLVGVGFRVRPPRVE
jgi:hypothetical protein